MHLSPGPPSSFSTPFTTYVLVKHLPSQAVAAVLNMCVPSNTQRFHTHTHTHATPHTHAHTQKYNKNKNTTSPIRLPSSHNHATHASTGVPHLLNLPVLAMGVRSAASSGIPTTLRARLLMLQPSRLPLVQWLDSTARFSSVCCFTPVPL